MLIFYVVLFPLGGQAEEGGGSFGGAADGDELEGHQAQSQRSRERATGSV